MDRFKKSVLVVSIGMLLLSASCRSDVLKTEFPEKTRIVKDDLGNEVKLPLKVTRAVSLAPNLTEIAFAIGAGDRLVGVTTFCNYPDETAGVKKIGDTLNPNVETIVALKPQVVFVTTASQLQSFSKVLLAQGIQVFITNPSSLDGVYNGIEKLGEVFDETANAKKLVGQLKGRISKLDKQEKKSTVFVQIDPTLYTIGKNSFISDALSNLPLKSVTDDIDEPYPKISKERGRSLSPEVIIITNSPGNQKPNRVFDKSPAVVNKRVIEIDADILSRPGPRIADALEEINAALKRFDGENK